MSLEDIATKVVTEYGKRAGWDDVHYMLDNFGFRDEDGELATRVMEMVRTAVVRVKVKIV